MVAGRGEAGQGAVHQPLAAGQVLPRVEQGVAEEPYATGAAVRLRSPSAVGSPSAPVGRAAAATGRLGRLPRTPRAAARVAVSGILPALFQAACFAAVETTSVGLATLTTMVAVPVLVTAGSSVLDRRPPTPRALGAVVVAVAGLMLLLGSPAGGGGNRAAGTLLALLAAAGFAVLTLYGRAPVPGLEPAAATGLGFLTGGLLLLPAGLLSGMGLPLRADTVGTLMFLGLVPTAVAYTVYFAGLHRAGPPAGVVAVLLEPLTATLLAVPLRHEQLDGTQVLGALLVLVSIGIQHSPTGSGRH
ncbi:EamA family transporter [Streptomyces sp. CB03238]|nr:EamA family transporter [Streptomyces sp. CB03238]